MGDETPRRNPRDRRSLQQMREDFTPFPAAEPVVEPEKEDLSEAETFLRCLNDYCDEIVHSKQRQEFVELKDFDENNLSLGLDDFKEAKLHAEKLVKAEDHSGVSRLELGNAVKAGAMAFADTHVLTRSMARKLKRRLSDTELLYSPLPYSGRLSSFSKRAKRRRDGKIIEDFVDFKTALKAKCDILKRVDSIVQREKIHAIRPQRSAHAVKVALDENCFHTPEKAQCAVKDPLSYTNIMDDYVDIRAKKFVEDNREAKRRHTTFGPRRSLIL